jgi:hypothetical protein
MALLGHIARRKAHYRGSWICLGVALMFSNTWVVKDMAQEVPQLA